MATIRDILSNESCGGVKVLHQYDNHQITITWQPVCVLTDRLPRKRAAYSCVDASCVAVLMRHKPFLKTLPPPPPPPSENGRRAINHEAFANMQ